MRTVRRRLELGLLAGALTAAVAAAATLGACSQTPTPVPVRTFERAGKMDVVCLKLFGDDGVAIDPEGRPQTDCTPVPARVSGDDFTNQLFGLVTQTARGEVAVVNLSGGFIEDANRVAPGSNFLPVGTVPTDIAATPDGRMVFVASAEPNKPAIYAIPTRRLLGDRGFKEDPQGVPTLASWPVCALPQNPGPITVVPRRGGAGVDGGAPNAPPYELVVVLPGDRRSSAKVVTLDPRPFLRGAGVTRVLRDGVEEDLPEGGGPVVAPGSLAECPTLAVVELGGEEDIPASVPAASSWSNGLPATGGAPLDLTCARPAQASCGLPACCDAPSGAPDAGPVAGNTPGVDCQAPADGGVDAGDEPLALAPVEPPRLVALARDDQTLYVADEGVPLIHVVDLSTSGSLVERAPLVATSDRDPSRPVGVRALAVSPATRDFKKFLYAVDAREGSVMIFDVTDPASTVRTPLRRPNPELNPFQPPDRLALNAPVVAVTFARTDYPLTQQGGLPTPGGAAPSGLLCNPNPNAPTTLGPDGTVPDPGVFYRPGASDTPVTLGPRRLRGVFAFVTMSNGVVAVVDVDDWDAPCRRPTLLNGEFGPGTTPFSVLALAQPGAPAGDLDPYHVPVAPQGATTNEAFFPVSAPHRLRSSNLLVESPTIGKRYPFVLGVPTVDRFSTPLPLPPASGSETTPILTPTIEPSIDVVALGATSASTDAGAADGGAGNTGPRLVGPRMSFEAPDVHIDQDWTVTYEGALPGLDDVLGTITTTDGYRTATLDQPQGSFCGRGVEDAALGRDRAAAFTAALARDGRPALPEPLETRVADYVQITSELLPPEDPYWSLAEDVGTLDPAGGGSCFDGVPPGRQRYDACSRAFGSAVDENASRDFPILEAYDGRLVLGRFFTFPGSGTVTEPTRQIVYGDPSNAPVLKQLRCCFHGQPRFRVRAASTWVTAGAQFGFLHKVQPGAGGRCVQSCDPTLALRNGRAFTAPARADDVTARVSRDSAIAMRNPLFSFFLQGAAPERDTRWRFSTRGQFDALTIVLGGGQTVQVNPQSMRFVEPFNQVAVVDAASQGLVLIDLRSVVARSSYF